MIDWAKFSLHFSNTLKRKKQTKTKITPENEQNHCPSTINTQTLVSIGHNRKPNMEACILSIWSVHLQRPLTHSTATKTNPTQIYYIHYHIRRLSPNGDASIAQSVYLIRDQNEVVDRKQRWLALRVEGNSISTKLDRCGLLCG